MPTLLTANGVPPQKIGSLTPQQQQSIIEHASGDIHKGYDLRNSEPAAPLQPFAAMVRDVADCFTKWGASIDKAGHCFVQIKSDDLAKGGTTFQPDANLHADRTVDPESPNRLALRFLCVSSMPATFLDLTRYPDMEERLDPYRVQPGARIFNASLLHKADQEGDTRRFSPWDTVLFDSATPHLPQVAYTPHRRILLSGWIDASLPRDWRARLARNDAPFLAFNPGNALRAEVQRSTKLMTPRPEQP